MHSSAQRKAQPSRVLLVEDDPEICVLLSNALAAEGYDVLCAPSDSEAYAALVARPRAFAVLIADVDLGRGTTGYDVARFARRLNPELGVIYTSGGGDTNLELHGVPGGVLVQKPFRLAALVTEIRRAAGA
jgi:DNA-binding response OmpR family regulator